MDTPLSWILPLLILLTPRAFGQDVAKPHGPEAPDSQFPSHVFELAPRVHPRAQLAFHYGLVQPLISHGFNAAVDVRFDRWVFSYSHGQGLQFDQALTDVEKRAGLQLNLPFTTGLGVGLVLVDELYVLADFKLHHFAASLGEQVQTYDAVTIGAELGWRFFIWKGLYLAPVVRFWPNVWTSVPAGGLRFTQPGGTVLTVAAAQQGYGGLFGNLLLGWAFNL